MMGLNKLLSDHATEFPEFLYYRKLIGKSNKNLQTNPDIAIEACNSLLQGVCKTAVKRLGPAISDKELNKKDTDWLIRESLTLLKENDDVYEDDFVRRAVSLALSISTLRNARGDISHGKAVPKTLSSNMELAKVIHEIASSLTLYILSSLFVAMQNKKSSVIEKSRELEGNEFDVNYEDCGQFNDFLDSNYPQQGKIVHSVALFEMFREEYVIQLEAFNETLVEDEN